MTENLDAIRRDLLLVLDGAKWAYTLGWVKASAGLQAERGASTAKTEAEQDEGEVYDIGVADHKARVAYRDATLAVGRTNVCLAAMLRNVPQPLLTPCGGPYTTVRQLEVAVQAAVRRVDLFESEAGHTRRLRYLRTELDRAVRGLSAVLDRGRADGIAHNEDAQPERGIRKEDRCKICKLRKKAKKKGDRCNTCATYFMRNRKERPTKLDPMKPEDAQAKRIARGEHWGAA